MTSKDLDRLEKLADEVNILKDRLTALKNASAVSATNYSQNGGKCGVSDPVGNRVISEDAVREKIKTAYAEMETLISTVDDALIRDILIYRYIKGKTWLQIAIAMGYSDSQQPKRMFYRFKKNLQFCTSCTLDMP